MKESFFAPLKGHRNHEKTWNKLSTILLYFTSFLQLPFTDKPLEIVKKRSNLQGR